jgi:cytochrome c2
MLMHSLTRIRAACYSIMLASVGVFFMPPTVHAQGDAAAGEKVFAHCAPCHSNKPDNRGTKVDHPDRTLRSGGLWPNRF